MLRRTMLLVLCLLSLAAALPAQDAPAPPKGERKGDASHDAVAETQHTLTLNGAKLDYKATAGTLPIKDDDGKTTANVFYVAYTKAGEQDLSKRPITFAFNGGPGSSAVWLHLGAFGPRRVVLTDEGEAPQPPYKLTDNEDTLLDQTDLVFIDPVSTGYSRPAEGQNASKFHGVEEDVHSVGEFIRLYVTRHNRWASPKFLAGESYGTTRAAGLVGYVQERLGMNFNGVVLVSCVLNFGTLSFDEGNDLAYPLFLPTYTAAAWYHKRLPEDLQGDLHRALAESEKFALGDYTLALMKGDKLPSDERQQVQQRLARLIGLSEAFIGRNNLRVSIGRFTKELLRGEHRIIGRYDSRLTGDTLDPASDRPDYDPSYTAVQGPFTAALNQYLRTELKYESDVPYEILTGKVQPWKFPDGRYLNVSPTLRQALTTNRELRVFVANGYYDLATPYLATQYTFNHLGPEPAAWSDRVTFGYYDAGHMMYTHRADHHKLKKDLAGFIQAALGGR